MWCSLEIKPNLLILDYFLPGINGLELSERLHAINGLEAVPTMMMSAMLPTQEVAQRGLLGIQKPFDLDIFLDMITHLLA